MFRRIEIAVIFLCLLVALSLFTNSLETNRQAAMTEFKQITQDNVKSLEARLDIYLQSLNSAAGLMLAKEDVEFDDFEILAQSVDLETRLPGINGIGFV